MVDGEEKKLKLFSPRPSPCFQISLFSPEKQRHLSALPIQKRIMAKKKVALTWELCLFPLVVGGGGGGRDSEGEGGGSLVRVLTHGGYWTIVKSGKVCFCCFCCFVVFVVSFLLYLFVVFFIIILFIFAHSFELLFIHRLGLQEGTPMGKTPSSSTGSPPPSLPPPLLPPPLPSKKREVEMEREREEEGEKEKKNIFMTVSTITRCSLELKNSSLVVGGRGGGEGGGLFQVFFFFFFFFFLIL